MVDILLLNCIALTCVVSINYSTPGGPMVVKVLEKGEKDNTLYISMFLFIFVYVCE